MINNDNIIILPWWREVWDRLQSRRRSGRLPHALLVTGPVGLGKHDLVRYFSRRVLCQNSESEKPSGCGDCDACRLSDAGNHPDFRWVGVPEDRKSIGIDQIRDVCADLSLTSMHGGYKVAVVAPAELMTLAASNALLKTLEEPTDETLLVLITATPQRLPATVRSRCQVIRLRKPTAEIGESWLREQGLTTSTDAQLRLARGAPLQALSMADQNLLELRDQYFRQFQDLGKPGMDPVGIVAEWCRDENNYPLMWMTDWIMDMVRLRFYAGQQELEQPDLAGELAILGKDIGITSLYDVLDRLWQARSMLDTGINKQLLLEGLLIQWVQILRAKGLAA